MAAKLWSGIHVGPGSGSSFFMLVKAANQKRAVELIDAAGFGGYTVGSFKNYFSKTENPHESQVTSDEEEGVWIRHKDRFWQERVTGYVWCDVHGLVHGEEFDPFGFGIGQQPPGGGEPELPECGPKHWRTLYMGSSAARKTYAGRMADADKYKDEL